MSRCAGRRSAPPAPSHPNRRFRARCPVSGLPPSHGRREARLAARMAKLNAGNGAVCLDEMRTPRQGGNEFVLPQAEIADGPAAVARNLGGFHDHQAGAALGIAAGVDEMPIGGMSRKRRVLMHRRDHDPVLEGHAFDRKGRKEQGLEPSLCVVRSKIAARARQLAPGSRREKARGVRRPRQDESRRPSTCETARSAAPGWAH